MDKRIVSYQRKVLNALSGKIGSFYLAGGTALSLFYFQHRLSVDLDFFTREFVNLDVLRIVKYLKNVLKKEVDKSFNIEFTPSKIFLLKEEESTESYIVKTQDTDFDTNKFLNKKDAKKPSGGAGWIELFKS